MNVAEKVAKILVKRGFNIDTATALVAKNLADALRMLPDAKPGKLAEIVTCL
ncbi:TPA: hypothetical protein ACIBS5_001922 [Salmonella enterica subsp. diarizonae serovar 60-67:z35:-]